MQYFISNNNNWCFTGILSEYLFVLFCRQKLLLSPRRVSNIRIDGILLVLLSSMCDCSSVLCEVDRV